MAKIVHYTRDELTDYFRTSGLREEERPIDGRAYTLTTSGPQAIGLYQAEFNAAMPTRFYIDHHMFILAE